MADLVQTAMDGPRYDADFFAWTQAQAGTLRRLAATGVNLPVDLLNLAEEVESLGRRDRRTLGSLIQRIVEHLIKLEHAPARDPRPKWKDDVRHW